MQTLDIWATAKHFSALKSKMKFSLFTSSYIHRQFFFNTIIAPAGPSNINPMEIFVSVILFFFNCATTFTHSVVIVNSENKDFDPLLLLEQQQQK